MNRFGTSVAFTCLFLIIFVSLSTTSVSLVHALDYDEVSGHVKRLYPQNDRIYISLKDGNKQPKGGYFILLQSNKRFKETYALILEAAVNNIPINIRCGGKADENPRVSYVTVDF